MNRLTAAVVATVLGIFTATWLQAGHAAGTEFADGLNLFKQKAYREAAQKFEIAMRNNPRDANSIYYCALSSQMANNRARARQLYQYIASAFPGSRQASMADSALKSLGDVGSSPVSASGGASGAYGGGGIGGGGGGSRYSGPSQFTLPFTRGRTGGIYVEVQVNDHPVTFHLDTGAHSTVIGANRMDELGLARPASGEKFVTGGVGERQNIPAWNQKVDLKLGTIYARDFTVTVQDYLDTDPLLGQDFLRDWNTTVDESARQVVFVRKGSQPQVSARMQPRGTMDVPFVFEGNHMIVDGTVNGKPYKFYFDTGADMICFSMNDLKRLNLEDQLAGARKGTSQGVGGTSVTWSFPVERIKVGPIDKPDIEVSAVESSQMAHPLLGQSFFKEFSYTIDGRQVIHFKSNN